jgi:hypothetical protein
MTRYAVTIREIYEREAFVEAGSKTEARELVRAGHADDWSDMDYVRTEITNQPVVEEEAAERRPLSEHEGGDE